MERYCHEMEQIQKKVEGDREGSLLETAPNEREIAAVKRFKTLHIPDSTILSLTRTGKTRDGIRRMYLKCVGYRVRNIFPHNVVELESGEIVYVESFEVEGASGNLVTFLGRKFGKVRSPHELLHISKITDFY